MIWENYFFSKCFDTDAEKFRQLDKGELNDNNKRKKYDFEQGK